MGHDLAKHQPPGRAADAPPSRIPRRRSGTAEAQRAVEALEGQAGEPLDAQTQLGMTERFGHDFSRVRVHTDSGAAQAASGIGALAYSWDDHIGFARGRYAPGTPQGRETLAHELAHVVQRGRGGSAPAAEAVSDPAGPAEAEAERAGRQAAAGQEVAVVEAAPRAVHRQPDPAAPRQLDDTDPWTGKPIPRQSPADAEAETARLAEELLAALVAGGMLALQSRLARLDDLQKHRLYRRHSFMDQVRRSVPAMDYWMLQLQLHHLFIPWTNVERQLFAAVASRNAGLVQDLLRSFPELLDPQRVPGVRGMLDGHFKRHPQHKAVMDVAGQRETDRSARNTTTRAYHYDRPTPKDKLQLLEKTVVATYDVARTSKEVRVIVRIRLVNPNGTTFTAGPNGEDRRKVWREGIETRWNNRFVMDNGATKLNVFFVPMFTAERPHVTVTVRPDKEYLRSDTANWWWNADGLTAAHEFGHYVGNPDEYGIPATNAELAGKGLTTSELNSSTVEGIAQKKLKPLHGGYNIDSLMGDGDHRAALRHTWTVQTWFNMNLLQTGEEGYNMRMR